MKPVIQSLTLKGFRSFDLEKVELENPTFLVGPNAAGKSNLVDALAFLREAMRQPLDEVIRRRGGMTELLHKAGDRRGFSLNVRLGGRGLKGAHYSIEIRSSDERSFEVAKEQCRVVTQDGEHWFERNRKEFRSNVQGLRPHLDPHWLILPLLGGDELFRAVFGRLHPLTVFRRQLDNIRRPQKLERLDRLSSDWSSAANVVQYLKENRPSDLERISEILSAVTPLPTRVNSRIDGGMVSLEFEHVYPDGSTAELDALQMSEGTLQALGILLAVFQRPLAGGTLMVFEEPETNIHPGALSVITDLLHAASEKSQILVTTHSPELLDAKWIEDRHIRIIYWEGYSSHVSKVGKASRETLREGLMRAGELLRSSVLDAPPVQRSDPDGQLFEVLG
jgi:predicted ATPase